MQMAINNVSVLSGILDYGGEDIAGTNITFMNGSQVNLL